MFRRSWLPLNLLVHAPLSGGEKSPQRQRVLPSRGSAMHVVFWIPAQSDSNLHSRAFPTEITTTNATLTRARDKFQRQEQVSPTDEPGKSKRLSFFTFLILKTYLQAFDRLFNWFLFRFRVVIFKFRVIIYIYRVVIILEEQEEQSYRREFCNYSPLLFFSLKKLTIYSNYLQTLNRR